MLNLVCEERRMVVSRVGTEVTPGTAVIIGWLEYLTFVVVDETGRDL